MDGSARKEGTYTFGKYRLDPIRRTLTRDGAQVALTARLFDTLLYLVENRARAVARHELASAVWGSRQVDDANIAMAISSLRKSLQDNETIQGLIMTVPGMGYRFAPGVAFESAPPDSVDLHAAPEHASGPVYVPRFSLKRHVRAAGAAALLIAAAGAALLWRIAPVDTASNMPPAFAPPPRSIAVLAFHNESGDPKQDYFSDGLSEELISALSQVGGLHIAARSSAFSFKRNPASAAEIARRLNVGTVLSGSVGRNGGRLSIDARLTDGVTGATLWANHYDRDQRDILKTQAELAEAVTSALRVRLIGTDVAGLTLGGTTNPQALDAYLRAMAAVRNEKSEADYEQEIALFNEAVALDPGFAIAQAQRAIQLWSNAARTSSNDRAYVSGLKKAALAGAQEAVALAPDLAIAHVALGLALGANRPDFMRQEAEFVRARDLAPGSAEILRHYSRFEGFAGHFASAVNAAEQAVALDPLTSGSYVRLAWALYFARRPIEAGAALQHATELSAIAGPQNESLRGGIALMLGDADAARRACRDDTTWQAQTCLAIAYHALGLQNEALAQVAKLDALGANWGPFAYVQIYAQWGRLDDALTWLERSYDLPDQGIIQIEASPLLDPIRQSPRFKEIERRLDVPPQ
jgi:serine/threonine-protein kinase